MYWARQPGVEIQRIHMSKLTDQGLTNKNAWKQLNQITETDFRSVLSITASEDTIQKFPEPFQPFIRDHQDKLFLNKISEADIDKFLKGKPPMDIDDVKAKLPSEYHDFINVFLPKEADELPPHRPFDHKIELKTGAEAPYYKNRPMSPRELEVIKKYLDDHLNKGFIRRSTSPAAAPVLLAKKPGGGVRVCIDYRGLNAITTKNRYPIPLVRETLDALHKAKYYTKLDIIAAFNRLRMTPGEEWKTAFITRYGLYEYLVMPFGLQNAPAAFQHFINHTLHEFLDKFASAYLDDIIIYSETKKEHREHVRKVLNALQKAGLQIDINKCEFSVQETKYLGLIVSNKGLKMDPEKLKAIIEWKHPDNLKDLQSFLGFANFYRRFIKGFSSIVKSLTTLLQTKATWDFNDECKAAFQTLKDAFQDAPVLAYFDPKRKTVVETDASNWASGGVLSQYDEDGTLRPVAFFSAKHTPQECNYEIYDKELLAIIKALEEWRPELEGTEEQFDVITDHKNLQHFMTTKLLNQRQARWNEFLSRFNFRITYRPGKQGAIPDALSRRAQDRPASITDLADPRINHRHQCILKDKNLSIGMAPESISSLMLYVMDTQVPLDDLISQAYAQDPDTEEMIEALRQLKRQWPKHLKRKLRIAKAECKLVDGRIYFRDRLFIPNVPDVKLQVISRTHSNVLSGHPGRYKTATLLRRSYFWPGLTEDVARYVRNCHLCTRSKVSRSAPQGWLKPLEIPYRAWTSISIDYVVSLPDCNRDGITYKHVLVVIDRLTKMRHFIPCASLEADELATRFLRAVYSLHGCPDNIISDRGSQFISTFWNALSQRLGITLKPSSAYHPQTNGQTENANGFMEQYLRTYTNFVQDDWVDWLPLAEFACNNQVNESTQVSPFFANYGFNPRLGIEPLKPCPPNLSRQQRNEFFNASSIADRYQQITEHLRDNIQFAQERQEYFANTSRTAAPVYMPDDWVWVDTRNIKTSRPMKKLDAKFNGPFRVLKATSHAVTLDLPKNWKIARTFHTSLVRPASSDPFPGQDEINEAQKPQEDPGIIRRDDNTGEEHIEWEFTHFLDSRHTKKRGLEYRIQWKNSAATWQPAIDVKGCDEDIIAFHRKFPDKPGPPEWFDKPLL